MARKKQNTRIKEKKPFQFPWKLSAFAMIPVLVIAATIYAKHWLSDPNHLTISDVDVVGDLQYSNRETLVGVIEPFINTNLQLLDVEGLESELEFEPWIRSVAITKMWPSKVLVEITEQSPIAFWGDDRLVNNFGEVFDASLPSKKGVMPMLYNPDDKGLEMIEKYQQIQQWLKNIPLGVSEFIVDARGSWRIRLTNGWLVNIGQTEQEKRLRRLVAGYKKELADKADKVRKVDLRYTNGFAVNWK